MAERGEENRFAHLLAPIRDLGQNWHTDIAAELSDYLTQLEEITFTFDGGNTNLNFAEAALLIQGSTCVYSRKVEYLHKLVYNALEAVAHKRRVASDPDAAAQGEYLDDGDEDVAAFLALDDALQEGAGIDLDESAAARVAVTPKASDAAFWALREAGTATEGEAAFKIAGCCVHFTGALLLDPRDAALLDEHLQYRPQAEAEAQPAPPAGEGAAAMEEGGGGAWGDEDGGYYPGDDAPMQEPGGTPLRALGHDGEEEEEEADPWEPLDYNDPDGLPVRPFRKGRTQRRDAPPVAGLGACEARAQLEARAASRLGALFPEFAYAHEARAKTRQRERAAAARAQAGRRGAPGAPGGAAGAGAGAVELEEEGDFDDFAGGFGGGMSDDDAGAGAPLDSEALEAAAAAGTGLPSLLGPRAPQPQRAPGQELSYEDAVRAHVESCLASAAAAETQTELAARVAGWKAKVEPALLEQEARPTFDIHALGADVISALEERAAAAAGQPGTPEGADCAPAPLRFHALMQGRPVYQVARAFAATLQLVNAGNVRVEGAGEGEGAFTVHLLSASEAYEVLDAYRAPSMRQDDQLPVAHPKKATAGKGKAARAKEAPPPAKRRAALAQPQASGQQDD